MKTIDDLTNLLSEGLSGETLSGWTRDQSFYAAQGGMTIPMEHLASPRAQLRQLLLNMATVKNEAWDGQAAAEALISVFNGGRLHEVCRSAGVSIPSVLTFPVMAMAFKRLADNEFGSIQPQLLDNHKLMFFMRAVQIAECKGVTQLQLASKPTDLKRDTMHTTFSTAELEDLMINSPESLSGLCGSISHEIALQRNYGLLKSLWDASKEARITVAEPDLTMQTIHEINNRVFMRAFGNMTHLILSNDMEMLLVRTLTRDVAEYASKALCLDNYSAFSPSCLRFVQMPELKVYRSPLWSNKKRALGLFRGEHWAATPVVWAPLLLTSTSTTAPEIVPEGQVRNVQTLTAGADVVNPDWVQSLEIAD